MVDSLLHRLTKFDIVVDISDEAFTIMKVR